MTSPILLARDAAIFNEAEQKAAEKMLHDLANQPAGSVDLSQIASAYKSLTDAAATRIHLLSHIKRDTTCHSDQ